MKKTQNVREGTRKGASRKKKELALALCVSLWMAGGSVALAGDLYIDAADNKVKASTAVPVEPSPAVGSTATDKTLSVTGGDWSNWYIYGGKANGALSGYTLELNNAQNIFYAHGGRVNGDGNATGNTVTIKNSTVFQGVYGGIVGGDGNATGNIVNLNGGVTASFIYGGNVVGTGDAVTGNTLNLSGTGNTVNNSIKNFAAVNITGATWGTPVLTLNGAGMVQNGDGTWAVIDTDGIVFSGVDALKQGQTTTLIQGGMTNFPTGNIKSGKYKIGTTLEGTGTASKQDADLIYTIDTGAGGGPTAREQTHNTVMGAEVGMAALSVGNDFVGAATEGLSLASNIGADGVSSFAQMGGGSMRQETGSHIDSHTWNAIIALGHANKKERGTMEYGAFFEYGTGNYTTHAEGDLRGDGSSRYTGGGLLAKYTMKNSVYVEGSLRAGSIHDDARNVLRDGLGNPYSYETDAPYFGGHIGVGKEIPLANGNAVDVYGKYFYNRRNGVDFNAGGHYDLDAVTSSVIRLGARYTVKSSKWQFYAGTAYEHEMDGKANGTADGVAIRGADIGGGSFRGELGATMTPGENSTWKLDLNVTGFAGKKQGFTGGVSVAFMF